MKIKEKFENFFITDAYGDFRGRANYLIIKKEYSQFNLNNFHPTGESEVFICGVIKGTVYRTIASLLSALHMKAYGSCKIQVENLDPRGFRRFKMKMLKIVY